MVSKIKYIEKEIDFLKKDIESLELSKNKAIFEEIAILDIHVGMSEEKIGELIKILKEKIGEVDRQYKKFYNKEVKKELDYWQERAIRELAFLYVLRENYKEAIALLKKQSERNRPTSEKPFSDVELIEIFFFGGRRFLKKYERFVSEEQERLVKNIVPDTRDKNVKQLLRVAFVFGKCMDELWEENKQKFDEEDAKSVEELMTKINNIEGEIV